jgi:hypothetical protein
VQLQGHGRKRQLGNPTVVDRLIRQSISQILRPVYGREFSDNSFGFRPKRSTHSALNRGQSFMNAGYKYGIGEIAGTPRKIYSAVFIRVLPLIRVAMLKIRNGVIFLVEIFFLKKGCCMFAAINI